MEANIVGSRDYDPHLGEQSSTQIRKNPLDELPVEISLKIFSKLPVDHLGRCGLVSKQWQALSDDESLWKRIPDNAFGAKQWEEFFFGLKVDEPPLPLNIHKILKSRCPFSDQTEKRINVEDTHVLVLIPGSINEKDPLTLEAFGKLVESRCPKLGKNGYRLIWDKAKELGGDGKSHWVLMTKDVLYGSRREGFSSQQMQIKEKGKGNYQVPGALEAVICAIVEYVRSDENTRLLNDNPWTYTLCKEKIDGYQVCVGGFAPSGLIVYFSNYVNDGMGVAALRKC